MRYILRLFLFWLSRALLHKYKPEVIGITGSVGKTSTKEALYFLLKRHIRVRQGEKNFNTGIGVPLAILGMKKNPGNSPFAWLMCIARGLRMLIIRDFSFPSTLILEMGADDKGDISYLTRLAPCTIGILTAIGPAHLEKFGTMEDLVNEKKEIIKHLSGKRRLAVINADDPFLYPLTEAIDCRIVTFGLGSHADVFIDDIRERAIYRPDEEILFSLTGEISINNEIQSFELTNVVGRHMLYPLLAAISIAYEYHIPSKEIIQDLREYRPQKGRMRLISGIKRSLIIDDTYNSSPLACKCALESLSRVEIGPLARRIAILGDMLELGSHTEKLHREVGVYYSALNIDHLVVVGSAAQWIADSAQENGIDKERIIRFDTPQEAAVFLRNDITIGDVVLAKASQGIRLEKLVKELMADPQNASYELVRQDVEWFKS